MVKMMITGRKQKTQLVIPPGTIKFINKIERAFLCSAKDTTIGAKCKVN
jgi:hypothetical protein